MNRTGWDEIVTLVATRSYEPGGADGSPAGQPTFEVSLVHDTPWVTLPDGAIS